MDSDTRPNPDRRSALACSGRMIAGVAVCTLASTPLRAIAGKASKRDFSYQDHPKDGKRCADCRLFSRVNDDKGVCALVDGDVSPGGWCMAFSQKT
jgi:hypothetical protein